MIEETDPEINEEMIVFMPGEHEGDKRVYLVITKEGRFQFPEGDTPEIRAKIRETWPAITAVIDRMDKYVEALANISNESQNYQHRGDKADHDTFDTVISLANEALVK